MAALSADTLRSPLSYDPTTNISLEASYASTIPTDHLTDADGYRSLRILVAQGDLIAVLGRANPRSQPDGIATDDDDGEISSAEHIVADVNIAVDRAGMKGAGLTAGEAEGAAGVGRSKSHSRHYKAERHGHRECTAAHSRPSSQIGRVRVVRFHFRYAKARSGTLARAQVVRRRRR